MGIRAPSASVMTPSPGDNDPAVCIKGFVVSEPAGERPRVMMRFIFPLSPRPRGLWLPWKSHFLLSPSTRALLRRLHLPCRSLTSPPIKRAGHAAEAATRRFLLPQTLMLTSCLRPALAVALAHQTEHVSVASAALIRLIGGLLANMVTGTHPPSAGEGDHPSVIVSGPPADPPPPLAR